MRVQCSLALPYFLLLGCLFVCCSLSGCQTVASAAPRQEAPTPEPSDAEAPRPIRIAINEDLPTLDPHHHLTIVGGAVLCNIFEPLVCRTRRNEPIPCLAERWSTDDSQSWRFYLRPKVRFHDGSALTVGDVVFSLERARNDPRSEIGGFLSGVSSIKADLSAGAIDIVTRRPEPFFLESLSMIPIVPASSPAEIIEPIGTGPYRFVAYHRQDVLRLQRFEGYWNEAPPEAAAEFAVIPDAVKAAELLEAGEVDLTTYLPPRLVERIESNDDLWVESLLSQSVIYLQLNSAKPPFDDPRIRQAIDLAVDREALMTNVTLNHTRPASQMLAPSILGHDPHLVPTGRSLGRARQLLKEARGGEPVAIAIDTTAAYERHAIALAAQLAEVGFEVEIRVRQWPELYKALEDGEVSTWLGVWAYDSSDGAVYFNVAVHSPTDDRKLGSSNLTRYSDPQLDALIRSAGDQSDLTAREAKLQEISRRWVELDVEIPLLWPLDLYGTRQDLEWEARKDSALHLPEMRLQRQFDPR
ncbi:MAG: ABC transporter substrate-binding protein [Acidobacteriota bacterium]